MADHTHNLGFLSVLSAPANPFSERILVGKKGSRKHIVHYNDKGRLFGVLLAEEPAA